MKVFISWSGERSQTLAEALRNWLPLVLHFVEPWVSKSDIDAGERWASEVGKELAASNYGVICITRENIQSSWILFEAGALAKSMEQGRVIPLLLDIEFKDISGPLAQFQAKKVEKDGLLDIVTSINKLEPQPVPEARLAQLFESLWPNLQEKVEQIPNPTGVVKHNRPQHEILEELVSGVRGLDLRFRESLEEAPPLRRRRNRVHPMMLRELQHSLELRPNDPMTLIILASFLKDDFPWLYELASDAYRAASSGNIKTQKRSYHRFVSAVRMLRHGPFLDELGGDKATYMIMRELERFLEFRPAGLGPEDSSGHTDEEPNPD
jgi:TIR domain